MSQEHQDEPVPAAPRDRRTAVMMVSAVVTVVLAVAALTLPVPYVVEAPGPAINTIGDFGEEPIITVDGTETYPITAGALDLTTVSLRGGLPENEINLFDALAAWLTPSDTLYPAELIYAPGTSAESVSTENSAAMTSSQESATAAALTALKIPYTTSLAVVSVPDGGAASGLLAPNDVLQAIDGVPVTGLEVVQSALAAAAGASVRVEVLRDGAPESYLITPRAGEDGKYLLGITLQSTFDFPFTVDISLSNIGGPSAGMIFALGIMDTLTPGDLTGGKHFAGTGTIDPDGAVGPIGGIAQKMFGARQNGADYFLAPAANCADVIGHIPDGLAVIEVATLSDAYDAVAAVGSGRDPSTLATCK